MSVVCAVVAPGEGQSIRGVKDGRLGMFSGPSLPPKRNPTEKACPRCGSKRLRARRP